MHGLSSAFLHRRNADATGRSTSLLLVTPRSPRRSLLAEGHPCPASLPLVAHSLALRTLSASTGVSFPPLLPDRTFRGADDGRRLSRAPATPAHFPLSFNPLRNFSSGEAPMPQGGLPACLPSLPTLPCLPPLAIHAGEAIPIGRRPTLHHMPSFRSAPFFTPHPLRGAEGVVPSAGPRLGGRFLRSIPPKGRNPLGVNVRVPCGIYSIVVGTRRGRKSTNGKAEPGDSDWLPAETNGRSGGHIA